MTNSELLDSYSDAGGQCSADISYRLANPVDQVF